MKINQLFFALIAIIGLLFGQSCKKCDTPEPVTVTVFVPAPVVVNNLVGTWAGKEFYKAYVNDSLTTTNSKDITLVLNANATGSFTAFSETSSIGWANPPSKFSIVTRITNTSASTAIGYLFDIRDSTATTQKWYTESLFNDLGGKKQKFTYEWQLTKK